MITRTLRMNPEYEKILKEEAKKHGLTTSALIGQIICRYVLMTRFTERTPSITLSYTMFDPLLEHISDKDLVEVAKQTGCIVPEEEILQRGKLRGIETVTWLLEIIYGKYGKWFNYTHNIVNDKERIHLAHQLSHKWSIYLGSYMKEMFKSVLDMDPEIETRANSVTIHLSKRSNQEVNAINQNHS
jgi:hypothetical protein